MKNEKYYIDQLETSLRLSNKQCIQEEIIDIFEELLTASTDAYLEAYENHNLTRLKELLDDQHNLRREFTKIIRDYPDQLISISSKLVQTYNIFNKILQLENHKLSREDYLNTITKTYSRAEEILNYLYDHTNVQHKTMVGELHISGSTLTDTLKVLESCNFVRRIGTGKYTFFNLTNDGRKYVCDNTAITNDESIVDESIFQEESRQMALNKAKYAKVLVEQKTFISHREYADWGESNNKFTALISNTYEI